MSSVGVRIENVSKYFGSLAAVNNLSLEIKPGSCLHFLAPRGVGRQLCLEQLPGFIIRIQVKYCLTGTVLIISSA